MKQPIKKSARHKVIINDAFRIHPNKSQTHSNAAKKAKIHATKRAKIKAAKRAEEAVQSHQIKYVVVHSIGHSNTISLAALEQLNYDIILTPNGNIISKGAIDARQGTIEIGLVGGYDEQGVLEDNHSEQQKNALISVLMDIIENRSDILIKRADEVYSEKKPNPSFSLNALVMARILDAFKNLCSQQRA